MYFRRLPNARHEVDINSLMSLVGLKGDLKEDLRRTLRRTLREGLRLKEDLRMWKLLTYTVVSWFVAQTLTDNYILSRSTTAISGYSISPITEPRIPIKYRPC